MTATGTIISHNPKVPSVLIRDLSDDEHRRLRLAAAYEDKSLSAYGADAIRAQLKRTEAKMRRELLRGEGEDQ